MLYFEYNGIKSENLGIIVNKVSHHDILSQKRVTKGSFDKINGSVFFDTDLNEPYNLEIQCTLSKNFKQDTIFKIKDVFKSGKGELILSNKPQNVMKVNLISSVNFVKLFKGTGEFSMTFEVQPLSYLISGKTWVQVSNSENLENKGNHESLPLYKVTASANCSIKINDSTMKFENVTKQFIIDTELQDVYGEDGENLNKFMTIDSDFIGLQVGSNSFSLSNVSKLEVLPRWCEI